MARGKEAVAAARRREAAALATIDRLTDALGEAKARAKMSEQQMTNRRLTAVQDVAWALINSPAFLFNHCRIWRPRHEERRRKEG